MTSIVEVQAVPHGDVPTVIPLQGMPTGVRVGSSVACYEFICRMAQITAESQPPTLSVCLRAKGDL